MHNNHWKIKHALLFLLLASTFIILLSFIFLPLSITKNPLLIVIFYLFQVLGEMAILFFIGRKIINTSWTRALHIHLLSFYEMFILPIGVYFIYISVFAGIMFLLQMLGFTHIPGLDGQGIDISEKIGNGTFGLILSFIIAVIIAPISEEIIFRGFIGQAFLSKWPALVAIPISSAIFAISHFQFSVIIPLFVIGIILGTLSYTQKSIIPGIVLHMINNASAFTILLFLK